MTTMTETLAQIDTPHVHAFIVLWDDKVIEATPVMRYMRNWSRDRVRSYCRQQGWTVSVVHELTRARQPR